MTRALLRHHTTARDMRCDLRTTRWLHRSFPFVLLACPALAVAQDRAVAGGEPIVIGQTVSIASDELGEERPIWIHTPPGYQASSRRYPVLYLLDGQAHFQHVAGAVDFLAGVGRIPAMFVVAVPNISQATRTRDLTPTPVHTFNPDGTPWQRVYPTAGGADHFLAFLTKELIPYIDQSYRTQPFRILAGHSFGGLFNVFALLEDPSVFRGHVIISPSLWWDDQQLVAEAEHFLQKHRPAGLLYVTVGNEGGAMLSSTRSFSAVLEQYATDSLRWSFTHLDQESHESIPHRSIYDGLEWIFQDLRFAPAEGADLAADIRIEAIDERFSHMSRTYGFTIPTPESFLNAVGYLLLQRDVFEEAIAVFAENTVRFPNSANTYDSLGDAHRAVGNLLMARDNYAQAYRMARAVNHPSTAYYKGNLDSVSRQLTSH